MCCTLNREADAYDSDVEDDKVSLDISLTCSGLWESSSMREDKVEIFKEVLNEKRVRRFFISVS